MTDKVKVFNIIKKAQSVHGQAGSREVMSLEDATFVLSFMHDVKRRPADQPFSNFSISAFR